MNSKAKSLNIEALKSSFSFLTGIKLMKNTVWITALSFLIISCNDKDVCREKVDLSAVQGSVKINRLEKELFQIASSEEARKFILNHPQVADKYMGITEKDSSEFYKAISEFYTNPQLKEFYLEGEKINNNFPDLESELNNLFRHIRFYFPSYHLPEVNTIVSGFFNSDYLIEDSLTVISIDYFYGEKSKYRPSEFGYMLARRTPELMVPGLALRIGLEKFVLKDSKDETLLNDMVSWGKVHYFMEKVMPCVPDSAIIMYSAEELEDVNKHLNIIWGHFIENKLFYETKNDVKRRYVEEAPKVAVIGEKCPGRIGRYLGWQIVRAYMEKNPEVTLAQLMGDTDAQKIFRLSKYKPRVN